MRLSTIKFEGTYIKRTYYVGVKGMVWGNHVWNMYGQQNY